MSLKGDIQETAIRNILVVCTAVVPRYRHATVLENSGGGAAAEEACGGFSDWHRNAYLKQRCLKWGCEQSIWPLFHLFHWGKAQMREATLLIKFFILKQNKKQCLIAPKSYSKHIRNEETDLLGEAKHWSQMILKKVKIMWSRRTLRKNSRWRKSGGQLSPWFL